MKRVLVASAVVLCLAACKKAEDASSANISQSAPAASDAPPSQARAQDAASDANAAQADAAGPDAPPVSPQAPQLAMAYTLGLVLPSDQVRPLMESHQEACERAGPDQCQVLGAQAKAEGKDDASAELTLRATPAWMRMFRGRAEADAKDLGGRIATAGTEGDDLGGSIVDSQAAQQARAAERERLTELMRHKTKDLDQTLQVEQEITRVQGEMDQSASELAAMKNRVAMQTLTVSYQSTALAASDGVSAPLAQAGRGFMGHVFEMLALLVTLASFLLPFALVGGPVIWWLGRRRKAKTPARPATDAA